ncbi:MAG TPA: PAS domain-containing protein, partial [Terriglobales bacterium]|nr:PAS domain-containing protein [Terriglobales bacterium]
MSRAEAVGTDLADATFRARVQELLDRAGIGIAQIDTAGTYLLLNDRYCELVGHAREDLLGRRVQDFMHEDELPAGVDALITVMETGTPATLEQRHRRRDGTWVWLSSNASLARDDRGAPLYVLLLAQDIATRKANERRLVRAQSDLRLLLDAAADGLYCIDRDGKATLCNTAFVRMLGFEREEDILGKDVHELIHRREDGTPYHSPEECPVHRAARNGTHAHVTEEQFLRRDGKCFPVEYWARPIVREGQIQGAVCTFV